MLRKKKKIMPVAQDCHSATGYRWKILHFPGTEKTFMIFSCVSTPTCTRAL